MYGKKFDQEDRFQDDHLRLKAAGQRGDNEPGEPTNRMPLDIHWEGKQWEIWNATSHVNVNLSGKKTPISHFGLQTRGFVDAATQDGIQLTMDGPHYSPTGTGQKILCLYQFHHPESDSIEASVQLIHEISAEAPQYVQSFIRAFK